MTYTYRLKEFQHGFYIIATYRSNDGSCDVQLGPVCTTQLEAATRFYKDYPGFVLEDLQLNWRETTK